MQTNWIFARRKAATALTAKAAVSRLGPVLHRLKCQGSEETRNVKMLFVLSKNTRPNSDLSTESLLPH